jgi:hypothetical protein
MKEYRGTLLLLGALLALGAVVYLLEGRGPGETTPAADERPVVYNLNAGDVVGLTVRDGTTTTSLARDATGTWQVSAPTAGPADPWQAESLVSNLATLHADRLVAERVDDPAAYGLDRPTVEVATTLASGGEERLLIGAQNPRGTGFYARKANGEALYLVSSSFVSNARQLAAKPFPPTPVATPSPQATPGS